MRTIFIVLFVAAFALTCFAQGCPVHKANDNTTQISNLKEVSDAAKFDKTAETIERMLPKIPKQEKKETEHPCSSEDK